MRWTEAGIPALPLASCGAWCISTTVNGILLVKLLQLLWEKQDKYTTLSTCLRSPNNLDNDTLITHCRVVFVEHLVLVRSSSGCWWQWVKGEHREWVREIAWERRTTKRLPRPWWCLRSISTHEWEREEGWGKGPQSWGHTWMKAEDSSAFSGMFKNCSSAEE